MASRQKFAFAKRGAAVMLAAALATSMTPVMAVADAGDVRGDATASATNGDGFALVEGQAYTVGVTYVSDSSTMVSMAQRFLGSSVSVVQQGGVYSITFTASSAAIEPIVLDGITATRTVSGNTATHVVSGVTSLLGAHTATITVGGEMEGMPSMEMGITFDTSTLPTEEPEAPVATEALSEAITAAKAIQQGDKSDEAWKALQDAIAAAQQALDAAESQDTVDAAVAALNAAVETFNNSGAETDPGEDEDQPNRAALKELIEQAKAIEQGSKSDEAWQALQKAIATAEGAANASGMPDAAMPMVTKQLQDAIDAFNASEDVTTPVENPYNMEVGKEYSASVAYAGTGAYATADFDAIVKQMMGRYFGNSVTLQYLEDSTYNVIFSFVEYSAAMGNMTYNGQTIAQSADQTYTVNVPSLANPIDLGVYIGGAMEGMFPDGVTFAVSVDTTSIKAGAVTPDGEQGGEEGTTPTNPSDPNVNNNPTNVAEEGFQVGHTYQVPISFNKTGTFMTSMSAQYFGDTALVRPQADGTFRVSFSTNRPDFIASLTSASYVISQSGSQYTFSMPAMESDVTIPISMSIVPMNNMSVSADMHLYLTQAVDLGEGQEGLVASSTSTFAQTNDNTAPFAGVVGLTGVAAAGVALAAARRRMSAE